MKRSLPYAWLCASLILLIGANLLNILKLRGSIADTVVVSLLYLLLNVAALVCILPFLVSFTRWLKRK